MKEEWESEKRKGLRGFEDRGFGWDENGEVNYIGNERCRRLGELAIEGC
jgi:hypothetical protein